MFPHNNIGDESPTAVCVVFLSLAACLLCLSLRRLLPQPHHLEDLHHIVLILLTPCHYF
jgi:hypothetical protein